MAINIIKSLKKDVSIKHMIHQRLAGWEPPRLDTHIHASDLLKDGEYCPREWAFLDLGDGKKRDSFIGTSLRMTFDHGKDLEWRIRNDYLRDVAVGHWSCGVCDHDLPQFSKAPKIKCPKCGFQKWEYKETRFVSPTSGVSGALDLLVDVGEPKLRILEIKTISPDEFKKIVAPLAEHKFRTTVYLRLAAESDQDISERVNISAAHVLYVSKAFGLKDESLKAAGIKDSPFSPFKEFIVKRDDSMSDKVLARAETLTHWRNTNHQGMPCGVCQNGFTKRAQSCSSALACWSGAHPATLTWKENGIIQHPGKKVIGGS